MFVVEKRYDGGPYLRGKEDVTWTFDKGDGQDLERAAQRFESEAEAPHYPLPHIVYDLAEEGKVEYDNAESCVSVVAYELVEAVV